MTEKVLCVDDEPRVLRAYERTLDEQFDIEIAVGGEEALEAISQQGPYAVVVADMRMPGMNGVELLAEVRQRAPDTVRMMLTGNADQQTALEAVNQGHIFRFMTKPCPPDHLRQAFEAAAEQHRLVNAERVLLEQTLRGSINTLTDILAMINPAAFGRAIRARKDMSELADALDVRACSVAAIMDAVWDRGDWQHLYVTAQEIVDGPNARQRVPDTAEAACSER